ncbi:hypothetical protein V2J09_014864 [Rumex salicifolius]
MRRLLHTLLLKRSLPPPTNSSPILRHFPILLKSKHPSTAHPSLYQWRKRFSSLSTLRHISSTASSPKTERAAASNNDHLQYETEQEDGDMEWEEEEETEHRLGDGGDGGGVELQNIPWGDRVLSIAHEVLSQFSDDIQLFAFKVSPRGYIYVRLDKISNDYGCPSVEEIESYSRQYKKRLEEEGSKGEIPDDLALELSSPGAERLLRVPDDLPRFQDFPMIVSYVEDEEAKSEEKSGVFYIDSIEQESGNCVWKLADVKENRDPLSKGRPLSRKRKEWRLKLPYTMHKKKLKSFH